MTACGRLAIGLLLAFIAVPVATVPAQDLRTERDPEAALLVTLSADGRWLATQGDRTTSVWDLTTSQEVRRFRTPFLGVAVTGRGPTVALGGDRAWSVFDVRSGTPLMTIEEDGRVEDAWSVADYIRMVNSAHLVVHNPVAFDSGGRQLAVGHLPANHRNIGQVVRVIALPRLGGDSTWGKVTRRLTIGIGMARPGTPLYVSPCLALSPDDRWLAVGGKSSGGIVLDDAAAGTTQPDGYSDSFVLQAAFSADGRILATGDLAGAVVLRDMERGRRLRVLKDHKTLIEAIAFSPAGQLVAASSRGGRVVVWEVDTGRRLYTWTTAPSVRALRFVSGGTELEGVVVPDADAHYFHLKRWSLVTGLEVARPS